MISDRTFTYYQPDRVIDGELEIPAGLFSFQAFRSEEECVEWLKNNDLNPDDWEIHEYTDDDIEEVTLIDADGDVIPRIEEFGDDDIEDLITDIILGYAGSMDNLEVLKQPNETWDEFKDRVYGDALDMVNDAISEIEESGDYNFQAYAGCPDVEWYDEAREGAVFQVMRWMLGRYPDLEEEMEE